MSFGQTMNMGATMNLGATMSGAGGAAPMPTPVNESEMIKYIVDQVNEHLGRGMILRDFDSLLPDQRLQLVSDCFGIVDPHARVDLSTENYDLALSRMHEFLTKTLNYKPSQMQQATFAQDFVNGEKSVLYPMLWWYLHRMPENHKRVYLARFLSPVECPEDLRLGDDQLRELYQRWEQLRKDFIATHRRVDSLKEASADPALQRRRLAELEKAKGNLTQAIETSRRKLTTSVPNVDALLNACKALRAEKEADAQLGDSLQTDKMKLLNEKHRVQELTSRLRDVRRDIQDNKVDSIIQRLSDELTINSNKLDNELPNDLNERMVQIAALLKIKDETFDLQALEREHSGLEKELASLNKKMAERLKPRDDGQTDIATLKAAAQRVAKKRQDALGEFNLHDAERTRLTELLQARESQLEQLRSTKVLRGDEFKRFQNQVRAKTMQVKQMKARLVDLHSELSVLQYTEKLLKSKHEDLADDIKALENQLGARGFFEARESLDAAIDAKNKADQATGATLEELASIVQELGAAIRIRREKLKPLLDKLGKSRTQAQEVEQQWDDKKAHYESVQSSLMQEVTRLETEVHQLVEETRINEHQYHRMSGQLKILGVQKKRLDDEKEFRAGGGGKQLDATAKTHLALLHQAVESLETRQKDLHKRRRDIEDTHENSVQQVEYFAHLRKLLEAKERILQAQAGAPGGPTTTVDQDLQRLGMHQQHGGGASGANVFTM